MVNHTTGAQRYNNRMDKIFEEAKILNAKWEKIREEDYHKVRDNIINSMSTEHTINLVIDLLGNLKDSKEDLIKLEPKIEKDYSRLAEYLNSLMWG